VAEVDLALLEWSRRVLRLCPRWVVVVVRAVVEAALLDLPRQPVPLVRLHPRAVALRGLLAALVQPGQRPAV
jgi:hypothetical protein